MFESYDAVSAHLCHFHWSNAGSRSWSVNHDGVFDCTDIYIFVAISWYGVFIFAIFYGGGSFIYSYRCLKKVAEGSSAICCCAAADLYHIFFCLLYLSNATCTFAPLLLLLRQGAELTKTDFNASWRSELQPSRRLPLGSFIRAGSRVCFCNKTFSAVCWTVFLTTNQAKEG